MPSRSDCGEREWIAQLVPGCGSDPSHHPIEGHLIGGMQVDYKHAVTEQGKRVVFEFLSTSCRRHLVDVASSVTAIPAESGPGRALACLHSGHDVDCAIEYFRSCLHGKRGMTASELLATDSLNFILPHIATDNEFPLVRRCLDVSLALAAAEVSTESAFQNPEFCARLLGFITDDGETLRVLALKLCLRLLKNKAIRTTIFQNLVALDFAVLVHPSELLTAANARILKWNCRLLNAFCSFCEDEYLEYFSELVPRILELICGDNAPVRTEAATLLSILCANAENRRAAYDHGLFDVIGTVLHQHPKEFSMLGLFECVRLICLNDGVPDFFRGVGFLNLVRGVLQDTRTDGGVRQILLAVESMLCENWEGLWDGDVIGDVLDSILKLDNFERKKCAASCLMKFAMVARVDCIVQMLANEFLDVISGCVPAFDDQHQIEFLQMIEHFGTGGPDVTQVVRASEQLHACLVDLQESHSERIAEAAVHLIAGVFDAE
jgi:hypothetical protein